MNFLFDIVVIIGFIFLLFGGSKKAETSVSDDYFFRLNHLRGFFALEIVIGHVVRFTPCLLYPLGKAMIISVAFFFFISAYGLARSFSMKADYLKTFPRAKFLYLILLSIIPYVFSCIVELVSGMELSYLPSSAVNLPAKYLSNTNWYLFELLLLYFVFLFCYRFMNKLGRVLFISCFCFLAGTLFFFMDIKQGWYCSIMAFPFGLIFYEYNDRFIAFLHTVWCKFLTLLLALLGCSSLLLPEDNYFGMFVLRNIMCLAGIFLLLYLCSYINIGNRILDFCGSISTEIYLSQFIWLNVTSHTELHYVPRVLLVTFATFVCALLFHKFNKLWKPLLSKSSKAGT